MALWRILLSRAESQPRRLEFRKVGCDAVTRVPNASYHLAVVALDVLHYSELTERSSSIWWGRPFPAPFGRTSTRHSSVSDSPAMLNGSRAGLPRISRELPWVSLPRRTLVLKVSNILLSLRSSGCMCLSFIARRVSYCVDRVKQKAGQRVRSSASVFPY